MSTPSQAEVVAIGEAMVELRPAPGLSVGAADLELLQAKIAGDVFNAAVCLRRAGASVRFIQKVGLDFFAPLYRRVLEREGLAEGIRFEEGENGVYAFDTELGNLRGMTYRRAGSPASRTLDDACFPEVAEHARRARVLLTSGIALAVQKRRDLLHALAAEAHRARARVCFVLNARSGLPRTVDDRVVSVPLAEFLGEARAMLPSVDALALSEDDLRLLGIGIDALTSPDRVTFLTRGAEGSVVFGPGGLRAEVPAVEGIRIVDTLGAGDAFAAGVVYGMLRGLPPLACAEAGAAMAALSISGPGTYHPGITREALVALGVK